MKVPTILSEPTTIYLLFLSHWARLRNDYESSRSHLENIFLRSKGDWDLLIAYDATLMMLEGRFEDSIDRFEEGWRIYSINSDPNSEYLTAYCRCFISFYAGDGLQIDLIRYASSLNADPVIKTLFKLPKENPLPEFF